MPVYNSQSSLKAVIDRLDPILQQISSDFEIILVNDGSRDASWDLITRLSQDNPRVRGINMMRNYGQHNALLCGIRAAKCETIVTMDDDLQHPPEEIPQLLARLDEGFDVVYGTPENERNGIMRAIASRITRVALRSAVGAGCREKRERIPRLSHTIARRLRRLSDAICFHRRVADMGHDALRCGNRSLSTAPLRFLQLHFH